MTFTDTQKSELGKPLDRQHIATRSQSGRAMSYVEGWHVIAEANRIFGFDGWTRETVDMREVRPAELVKNSNGKETWRVGFICKVRVTAGGIVREGTGYGSGALPDLGEAYESAVKEAETDAMKRAMMTFGNPFGLALYDKSQANVADGADEAAPPQSNFAPLYNAIVTASDLTTLQKAWEAAKSDKTTTHKEQEALIAAKDQRKGELMKPAANLGQHLDNLERQTNPN